ncbi:cyclic nucleotide-binding domain-containing protein [Thermodesulfobacteriota bacterium]
MDISEIQHTLENCELFKGLEKINIEKIANLCQVETYRAGEYVFHQGEFGERIYIIAEGHVFLERTIDLGSRKGNAVIGVFGKGKAFGCWSTILDEPHNLMSSAICKKGTKMVVLSGGGLRNVMLTNSELGLRVLEKICLLLRDRVQGVLGAMEKI